MRIDRKRRDLNQSALAALDRAKLAAAKGGLKAERVQGTDPSDPGGN